MDLSHLNEAQQEAVLFNEGQMMILAGAGSGKTRTLVAKIKYLLEHCQLSPYEILAVTFSNKASREMRERVSHETNIDLGALQITTFHALCAKILRSEATYIGLSRNFTIYDDTESKSLIKNILSKHGVNLKELNPNVVKYYIQNLKNIGFYAQANINNFLDEIDPDDKFFTYFKEYEAELHRSNAVDFGGLISGVLNLFESFPEIKQRYQKRYKYLLVDEYQDTNRAQFKLLMHLCGDSGAICVVGDEDQSIYSWRGADIRNILDFEDRFKGSKLIKLEQNYRSSKNIIEAASFVIKNNKFRKGKNMWTDNPQGEEIKVYECKDDRTESEFVGTEIKKLKSEGVSLEDIAVFYRTNSQSRMVEDSLRKFNLNYRVVAGLKFYDRKEIKDLISYLRVVVNSKDSLSLSRVINVPARGIGVKTLRKFEDEAVRLQLSLWELFEKIVSEKDEFSHLKLTKRVMAGVEGFVELIQIAKTKSENKVLPSEIYEEILENSGYLESLYKDKTHESQARIENLEELLNAFKQFEQSESNANLSSFLETVALDTEVSSEEGRQQEMVSLMTVHGSKGLEYEYVFVVGCEENMFPSFQATESGDDGIEEERRLFYVAMTRAMTKLYLVYSQARMLWGSLRFNGPSRFLDEIPPDYYSKIFLNTEKTGDSEEFDEFNQDFSYDASEENVYNIKGDRKYSKGNLINHSLYGDGVVMKSEGQGSQEKVLIKFKDGMTKKFMVDYAPLKLVERSL